MFWGNIELRRRLPDIVSDYEEGRLDRGTYKLRVGPEVYVSPTGVGSDQKNKTKLKLDLGRDFVIPAGQFAFLLTEETVTIPEDALAFISVRAKYKFRGLVNVSGFHVDPGFAGRLIFSVFNAGPGEVHLERCEECFHIWFADLRDHELIGPKVGYQNIPSEIINPIAGEIQSFAGLDAKITDTDKRLADKITAVEREQAVIKWATALLVGAAITLGVRECSLSRTAAPAAPPTATNAPTPPVQTPPVIAPPSSPATAPAAPSR
ncbi:deoxycytidine triphosphate deaminase [Methylobacterium sp. J-026]|uniref:dCTP deaminase domain-containing protein n=1 Tax=Methylobacterium sp. J-026 TaxID=2836624 RepID=UPI001FB98774|nr:deoxycytidine triphosphate deaminase [Methylobacterium sp. J-026]MCJ2134040.1 deoxycytidine triphosphate deaminase [Methylobacterium sp. J-026]